ncbi:TOBE domain-containing protein [Paracoccus hibiscisoli]
MGIRPEHIAVSDDTGYWPATAQVVETLGADTVVHAHVAGTGDVTVRLPGDRRLRAGETLFLTPERRHLHLFDADGHRMQDPA